MATRSTRKRTTESPAIDAATVAAIVSPESADADYAPTAPFGYGPDAASDGAYVADAIDAMADALESVPGIATDDGTGDVTDTFGATDAIGDAIVSGDIAAIVSAIDAAPVIASDADVANAIAGTVADGRSVADSVPLGYTDADIRTAIATGPGVAAWSDYYRNAPANRCATIRAAADNALKAAMRARDESANEWLDVIDAFDSARPSARATAVVRTVADYAGIVAARWLAARDSAAVASDVPADMAGAVYTAAIAAYRALVDGPDVIPAAGDQRDAYTATRTRIDAALSRPAYRRTGTGGTATVKRAVPPVVYESLTLAHRLPASKRVNGWITMSTLCTVATAVGSERLFGIDADYAPTPGAVQAVFERWVKAGTVPDGIEYRASAGVGRGVPAAVRLTGDMDDLDASAFGIDA